MMKHNLLRRLPALALALVMAASLCLSPAWADDPAPNPTPTPGPAVPTQDPALNTELIIFQDTNSAAYLLQALHVIDGDTITWNATGGVSVNANKTTVTEAPDGTLAGDSVNVTPSSNTSNGRVTVSVERGGYDVGEVLICYVFCGTAPFTITPTPDQSKNLPSLSAGKSMDLTLTVTNPDIHIDAGDIEFRSSSAYATIGATPTGSGTKFSTTIQAAASVSSATTITITMTFKNGGYSDSWKLTIRPSTDVPANRVLVQPTVLNMTAGETNSTLKATVVPTDATNKDVVWSTSNEAVATVDPKTGTVTAVSAGTATITATAADGSGASGACRVNVAESASAITLNPTSLVLDLQAGGVSSKEITPVLSGTNSSNVEIRWSTSNAACADFGGVNTITTRNGAPVAITGKKASTSPITITATAAFKDANNKTTATLTARCSVTVIDEKSIFITSMTLSEETHTMPEDGSFKLSVKAFTPSNASAKGVTWSSSNTDIITVGTDGTVTGKGAGQAVITAEADYGGAEAYCIVTVTEITDVINLNFAYDTNTPIGSNRYTYTFKSSGNDYIPVTAALSPTGTYGAADPVHWVSKNTSIVTVSNTTSTKATITAVGAGKTTVTAVPMDPAGKDRVGVDPAEIEVTVSGVTIVNDDENILTSLTLMPDRRQTVQARAWGSAYTGDHAVDWTSSDPSIVSINPKNGESTILTARSPGTATITARKGSYVATCKVTVTEDTIGLIEASTPASTAYQFSKLAGQLRNACTAKTGKSLAYITNLSVSSTDQGVLYDQHYSSEDTGAGVGLQDRYYPGTAPQGQRSLNDLSFVPKSTFSGTAEISYTAWTADSQSFSGVIRITVNGTGDVAYSSGDGSPVTFSAEDFNFYHPNLRSLSFTLPQANVGTLYYNYNSASQPGTKVTATDTYSRSGTPSLDRVTFVPNAGYAGTVKISYKGTDTAGRAFTGTVTIIVSEPSGSGSSTTDIYYDFKQDGWVTFRATDFSTACQRTLGESLSYVRFTPPPSSDGTLFYNYRGFSDFDSMVASTTSYYYSGTPALNGVSFVPITTTPGQVDIAYTGYTTRGNTFTGTIHIGQTGNTQQTSRPRYTVVVGQTVSLRASDFNTLCLTATNASLSYVQFTQLPAVSQGALRFTRSNNTTPNNVTTGTRFYYTNTGTVTELLGNVYFQAGATVGTVTLPFIGYNTNGVSFTDEITIQITPPTTTFTGTNSSPFRLTAAQIRSALGGSLSGTLSYITFTSLPNAAAGRLYSGYNGFGTGVQVNTGTPYYASGSPSIDQLSFVPRGRYNGTVTIGYTATNTTGQSVSGQLVFNVSNSGSSKYFSDLVYTTWAAPSVDYLYENGVTKGVTATTYGPNQQIQRGDFVLMLVRALNLSGSGGYSFPDVATTEYFANAVAIAKQLGVVNGDNGYFKPYSPVTRQDAMVIIKNALAASGRNLGSASASILNTFSDGSTVSSYATDAVSTLVRLGAVNGDNGRLLPHNSITRAEAAVILHFVMTM